MTASPFRWPLVVALSLSLVSPSLHAAPAFQEPGADVHPVVRTADLRMGSYRPRNFDANRLAALASAFLGRQYFVQERGGLLGGAVSNLHSVGSNTIVIYDVESEVARILLHLRELDENVAIDESPEERLVTQQVSLRYLSGKTALTLLGPLLQTLPQTASPFRIEASHARNLLTMGGSEANCVAVRAELEKLDVPLPQVRLTCRLLLPAATNALDETLASTLRALLPEASFRSAGFASLQTRVAAQRQVKLRLGEVEDVSYTLEMSLSAHDAQAGVLGLDACRLSRKNELSGEVDLLFETDLSLNMGEETVLGASAAEPIFVVLEVASR